MATRGWGTDRPVETLLFEEGYRFDFYQAVRLLEVLYPERTPVGEGSDPDEETLHFKSKVALEFPATDLSEITPFSPDGKTAKMIVNFMGLAGAMGPLPAPYTELILERVWHKDTAFRDFLDIFNHRLISLLYRVRKIHRLGLDIKSPEQSNFANYLFSLIGLWTKGLQGRMRVRDRSLLFYTALLAQQPRSIIGLELLLSNYFKVNVKGIPFCGRWRYLEADQVTRIGVSGQNQILGRSAVLGARIWDQLGKFEISAGPLTLEEFLDFLPIGYRFAPIYGLTRFYVGTELEFDVRLMLSGDEIPESRLGVKGGPRLGWTSWLKTRQFKAEYGEVRLCPRLLGSYLPEE